MSLDVWLTVDEVINRQGSGVFIMEHGEVKEIPRYAWDEMCPWHEPTIRESVTVKREVYSANITHNLGPMAREAGIYMEVWRPEEVSIAKAMDLVGPLERGIAAMKADPERFEARNAPNGWGTYKNFVPWLERYLNACREYPDADVRVSR